MTTQLDLDRALGAWLRDVPPHSDRARVAVLAQLGAIRQHRPRPSWFSGTGATGPGRTLGRSSFSAMRPLALVALIALGTGAVYFAAGQSPSPVPTPPLATPSPVPTARSATPSPTAPPSTRPLAGLLARLVTEAVEPGVLRVVSDGHRDLSLHLYAAPANWDSSRRNRVVAGLDGSVWLLGADEWYRVGEAATYPVTDETPNRSWHTAQVAPDGTLWTLDPNELDGDNSSALVSFEDGSWTVRQDLVAAFDLEPDGTVWVSTGSGIARLRDAPRTPESGDADQVFWVSPVKPVDGNAVEVLVQTDMGEGSDLVRLWIPEDGEPHGEEIGDVPPVAIDAIDMDPHGALWVYQHVDIPVAGTWPLGNYDWNDGDSRHRTQYLVHVTGASTTVYTDEEGLLARGFDPFRAAPDGSVWLTPTDESGSRCGGLATFDGTTWTRYLPGRCVVAFDISPDGTVWLQAARAGDTFSEEPDEADTTETFVIPG